MTKKMHLKKTRKKKSKPFWLREKKTVGQKARTATRETVGAKKKKTVCQKRHEKENKKFKKKIEWPLTLNMVDCLLIH